MQRVRSVEERVIRSYMARYGYRVTDPKFTDGMLQLGCPRNFQKYMENPEKLSIADLRRMNRTLKFSREDLLRIVEGE